MSKKCIDYRNGGMGNTILAHVLYASDKIDLSLGNFFSPEGNAHGISRFNKTELIAHHLDEFPDKSLQCVLKIISKDWTEIIRWKMSYSKWFKYEPNLMNWCNFFENRYRHDIKILWEDFYQKIRDPCWPLCDFEHRHTLPKNILQEIDKTSIDASFDIKTEFQLLEFLTRNYFDQLFLDYQCTSNVPIFLIDRYLQNDMFELKKLASDMGWTWNERKSLEFHACMLNANRAYLNWLNVMKENYCLTLQKTPLNRIFSTWELAALIAKICKDLNKDPNTIIWQEHACALSDNNVKLYTIIGL